MGPANSFILFLSANLGGSLGPMCCGFRRLCGLYSVVADVIDFCCSLEATTQVMGESYSKVKDSNVDLGVIFRFLQNSPITKAVCTKISKKFFLHFLQYFDISERK